MLPKNEKRIVIKSSRVKLWLYGAPFSGKTTLADQFPDALMLNTDGNLNTFTSPVVEIKERLDGREVVDTWTVFNETISELQQGSEFKTIVVDLVEDCFDACRKFCYKKLKIEHESDSGFGKGYDVVRTEFLTTMKRLLTLDYNIVLISHEDMSKDITKKSGDKITSIRPNIQDKVANKLAGMVDIVARVIADDDRRTLNFKSDDVVFGGGRLKLTKTRIPLTYEDLMSVYNVESDEVETETVATESKEVETVETKEVENEEPTRRRRRRRVEEVENENTPF